MSDAFKTSGSSPSEVETDFLVENHGSIFLFRSLTLAANSWIDQNLPEDRQTLGNAVAVEHRYIADIVSGARADGLTIR